MAETIADVIDNFELMEDWEDRYRYLIELGRALPPMPAEEHAEANKVRGCQSQVWLTTQVEAGPPVRLFFRGDSDAHIVKGLVALLLLICSGKTPAEILAADIRGVFDRLGLSKSLSPQRANGLYSMIQTIQAIARHYDGAPATDTVQG